MTSLDASEDAFLGGRLSILQPHRGYRAGFDAVLLAASVAPQRGAMRVLDAGAGVGTAGLCLAARLPDASVVLLEQQRMFAELARSNAGRNGLGERVEVIEGDILASRPALAGLGLAADQFDAVIANPPFHADGEGTAAKTPGKSAAHQMGAGALDRWCRFLATVTKPGGSANLIHKAEALEEVLAGLSGRFGALALMPVSASAEGPAIRILIRGIKGSRSPLRLLAPFVLQRDDGTPSEAAERILRHGAGLQELRPDWFLTHRRSK